MIYWFTGQPSSGKTVLAKKLVIYLKELYGQENIFHIDGDDIRELFKNKNYTIYGRVDNINIAQKIAHYLYMQDKQIVVSLVSPYIDQREDFKILIGKDLLEIYVHTSTIREREIYKSIAYIPPQKNYLDINTTYDNEEISFGKIKNYIKNNYENL